MVCWLCWLYFMYSLCSVCAYHSTDWLFEPRGEVRSEEIDTIQSTCFVINTSTISSCYTFSFSFHNSSNSIAPQPICCAINHNNNFSSACFNLTVLFSKRRTSCSHCCIPSGSLIQRCSDEGQEAEALAYWLTWPASICEIEISTFFPEDYVCAFLVFFGVEELEYTTLV